MELELMFMEAVRRVTAEPGDRQARAELLRLAREADALDEAIAALEELVLPEVEGEERGAVFLDLADCHEAIGDADAAARYREQGQQLLAG